MYSSGRNIRDNLSVLHLFFTFTVALRHTSDYYKPASFPSLAHLFLPSYFSFYLQQFTPQLPFFFFASLSLSFLLLYPLYITLFLCLFSLPSPYPCSPNFVWLPDMTITLNSVV